MGLIGASGRLQKLHCRGLPCLHTPFCRFLAGLRLTHIGLAWEGSPVASQHSYGGHSERSTCVQLAWSWLGSESHLCIEQTYVSIPEKQKGRSSEHPLVETLSDTPSQALDKAEDTRMSGLTLLLSTTTPPV